MRLARQLTGREPHFKRLKHLPGDTRAMLKRPQAPERPYEIWYARGQERFLPHLVAHEVGHLVRLYAVPEDERLMPASTAASRQRAGERILVDLSQKVDLEQISITALREAFEVWHQGVCTQLANFPADLRIEQWIHDQYPGLGRIQERSLDVEVHRAIPLLLPEVALATPPTVYRATMAMNAAQAVHFADLYDQPGLLGPFQATGFHLIGSHLARQVFQAEDAGHRSDMEVVNQWAEDLGLNGWFEWRPYTGRR